MRIGIDCRTILNPQTGEKAGVGYYTYHLVKGLVETNASDRLILFFNKSDANIAAQFSRADVEIVFLPELRIPFVSSHIVNAMIFGAHRLKVLHAPANIMPLFYFGKTILTVHDLAIYKFPEFFPDNQSFAKKVLVPSSVDRSDRIIAVSESTKKDLVELFHIKDKKISVIPEGVDLDKFKPVEDKQVAFLDVQEKFEITKPYILFIGTLEPRKNLINLIKAFGSSVELTNKYQLVIAGAKGWKYDGILSEAENLDGEKIVFTDYVSDEDKLKLLQAASVFAFPSWYEGFGLPVLEALACEVPVVCANDSSLPEIGGDQVTYVKPDSPEDIAKGLLAAFKPARTQAEKYSWELTIKRTWEVYKSIL